MTTEIPQFVTPHNQVIETTWFQETHRGIDVPHKVKMNVTETQIEFLKSPFCFKDDIKAMTGSDWLGYKEENPRKIWVAKNCPRNWVQIRWLMGENVYEWFDRPLKEHKFREFDHPKGKRKLREHQEFLANTGLTYHYQIWAAEMGVGKTLSAQVVMEESACRDWLWVGPLKSKDNILIELEDYGFFDHYEGKFEFMHYEMFLSWMTKDGYKEWLPQGVIFDESSRLKGENTQRSKAAQDIADAIREEYGYDGYVILMSGTPSPKAPPDWWRQCEIAWPGFLKEGSRKALQQRCQFYVLVKDETGTYPQPLGWKDDEDKCEKCGEYEDHVNHKAVYIEDELTLRMQTDVHEFRPSKNEVAFMYERLKGLVWVLHKKDVLDLPDKVYEEDICDVSEDMKNAARSLVKAAPNAITGMTWLREISDGFLYKEVADGKTKCRACNKSERPGQVQEWFDPDDPEQGIENIDFFEPEEVARLEKRWVDCKRCDGTQKMTKYKREVRKVKCPKEAKLVKRLAECEETGRIVIFAGFRGSLDKIQQTCQKEGWDVVRCDGDGWQVETSDGERIKMDRPIDYWKNMNNEMVAFVAHPASGGLSLNLTESRMAVFYSNDFNPESRSQAEDRVHRMGMDENRGCKIVDIYHLPSDRRVRDILIENRKLEKMTMGEILEDSLN